MTQDNPRRLLRAAIGAALVTSFAIGGAVQAAEIVQTIPLSVSAPADFAIPLQVDTSFNGFNVPGATLTAVLLSWDLGLDLAVSADDCSTFKDCDTSVDSDSGPSIIDWTLSGPGGAAGPGNAFDSISFDAAQWDYDITNDTDDPQTDSAKLSLIGSQALANLWDFIGAGAIGAVRNFSTTQADFVVYDTRVLSGGLTLKYTYTEPAPIPVPGTLVLLGIGLAGFGASRRRRAG